MPFFLKILSAPAREKLGAKIPLTEGEHFAGRASPPCEIRLDGAKVSKKHCLFRVEGETLTVEDLGSANGLYVNGKRVSRAGLRAKDRMVIGDFILEVTVK